MSQLNNRVRLVKPRKRVGRGGDLGGTSGRGSKGQNARSGGGVGIAFEGGQMPLIRRMPKRGFTNARFKTDVQAVSLKNIAHVFEAGAVVDRAALIEHGFIKKSYKGLVKVLGNDAISKKLTITLDAASAGAKAAIENAGGTFHVANS